MNIQYSASEATLFVLAHGALSACSAALEVGNVEYATEVFHATEDLLSVLATEAKDSKSVEELHALLFQLRDGLERYQSKPVLN